ncbi:MAG TPA: DUF3089 domain-containing protein [Gaiellaceae bacterium]|jgi:hypothetical protein|nr:DUF3089 domain-containing protein [Gaiellaceae bacterium]
MSGRILLYARRLVNRGVPAVLVTVAAILAGSISGAAAGGAVPHWKAWLCFPNQPHDWCYVGLDTVVVAATGAPRGVRVAPSSNPPVDCFYVYPTVSNENRPNADLRLQTAEKYAAIIQASQFSRVCRVFAPLYRQTLHAAGAKPALAYADVLAAWRDYLAHDNDGRGVVLIGHSQGASVLEELIRNEIEGSPAERRLLVSAILVGGNVVVPNGRLTGGTFRHVPACTSVAETGCVVAYSSWDKTPPADAAFESVRKPATQHVLCVNPASPAGGSAVIAPIFAGYNSEGIVPPGSPYLRYRWVEFTGLYTARCVRHGSRAWLLVTRIHTPGDPRPTVQEVDQPDEGLHAADINIDLANLVSLVQSEARAFAAHH